MFFPEGVIVIAFVAADPTLSLILCICPVVGFAKGVIVLAALVSTKMTASCGMVVYGYAPGVFSTTALLLTTLGTCVVVVIADDVPSNVSNEKFNVPAPEIAAALLVYISEEFKNTVVPDPTTIAVAVPEASPPKSISTVPVPAVVKQVTF